jgi:hypothetical protein
MGLKESKASKGRQGAKNETTDDNKSAVQEGRKLHRNALI